jgi:hypothetical protein
MVTDLRSLPSGFTLSDYRIEHVLGQGGFGITYLGVDTHLGRKVAIKEYYPREWAVRNNSYTINSAGSLDDKRDFEWGLKRFLKEAQLLARFEHPNIIAVRRFFEANGTAYLVMDYCDGKPLDEIIKHGGPLSQLQLERIWYPLLNGLEQVHATGFLHRDIKPANLYIRSDGSPVLLDFGSARKDSSQHTKGITTMVTDGYSPVEQYDSDGEQGPYTDIYGLAATLYRAITGEKPQASTGRILKDTLVPAALKAKGKFSENLLAAIDAGMALRPEDRPQKVSDWRLLISNQNKHSSKITQESPIRVDPVFSRDPVDPKSSIGSKNSDDKIVQSPTPLIVEFDNSGSGSSGINLRKMVVWLSCGLIAIGVGFLIIQLANPDAQVVSKPTPRPIEDSPSKNISDNISKPKKYISLYVSEASRSVGYSLDYPSQTDADKTAKENCEKRQLNSNDRCIKIAGGVGECLSISRSDTGAIGAAIDKDFQSASIAAQKSCTANAAGSICQISKETTFCK